MPFENPNAQIHQEAARYADQRAREMAEYLRGDENTRRKQVNSWLDYELAKPASHARIIGLESVDLEF